LKSLERVSKSQNKFSSSVLKGYQTSFGIFLLLFMKRILP
jgi:hypothetical protein